MSKQQSLIGEILRRLHDDVEEEVSLHKITTNGEHRGIRVDFWVPSINTIIEVHGIQHYKPSGFGKDKVRTTQDFLHQNNRDQKLRNICTRFSINYMEFTYTELNPNAIIKKLLTLPSVDTNI